MCGKLLTGAVPRMTTTAPTRHVSLTATALVVAAATTVAATAVATAAVATAACTGHSRRHGTAQRVRAESTPLLHSVPATAIIIIQHAASAHTVCLQHSLYSALYTDEHSPRPPRPPPPPPDGGWASFTRMVRPCLLWRKGVCACGLGNKEACKLMMEPAVRLLDHQLL